MTDWPEGHEPQLLAFCSCGWESPVYSDGSSVEIAWLRHMAEVHALAGDAA